MNDIKLTVDYSIPCTNELEIAMTKLKRAKELVAVTETHYSPLIKAGGEAKYDAIIEQLKPIVKVAKAFAISQNSVCVVRAGYGDGKIFEVRCDTYDSEVDYRCEGSGLHSFNKSNMGLYGIDGLITNWNTYNIIEKLKNHLTYQIDLATAQNENKVNNIVENYKLMIH